MSSCGGGTCGITKVREAERVRARKSVIDAYAGGAAAAGSSRAAGPGSLSPRRGESAGAGASARKRVDLAELGATFEDALPVRGFVADAEIDDLARWLYLLVGVHTPSLWELREGRTTKRVDAAEPHGAARTQETYVRVGVSSIGSYATLQECVFDISDVGGMSIIREQPQVGVMDTRLRKVVTCAQGVTRQAGLVLLDIAFLVEPAPPSLLDDAALRARVHAEPTMWSLLFDPAPPTTTREVVLT